MVKKLTKYKLLYPFLNNPLVPLILADFENKLGAPHQTVNNYLKELVKENILKKTDKRKSHIYELNFKNPMTFEYLATSERERTTELLKKNALLKRLYEIISPYLRTHSFVVFGSFAENLKGNDIDLLAIGQETASMRSDLRRFSKTYKTVHLVATKKVTKTLQKEIIAKHIILNDFSLFAKWLT